MSRMGRLSWNTCWRALWRSAPQLILKRRTETDDYELLARVWEAAKCQGPRIRISLDPREMVQIDSTDNETMSLQCGDRAETLTVVDPHAFLEAGAAH
jgi:hypothetical protein